MGKDSKIRVAGHINPNLKTASGLPTKISLKIL